MTEDIEKTLKNAPRTGVPESLDLRVEEMIRQAERQADSSFPRRLPLWVAAAACAVCAVGGFLAGVAGLPNDDATDLQPGVVYVESIPGPLPSVLTAVPASGGTGFFEKERGEVKTICRR